PWHTSTNEEFPILTQEFSFGRAYTIETPSLAKRFQLSKSQNAAIRACASKSFLALSSHCISEPDSEPGIHNQRSRTISPLPLSRTPRPALGAGASSDLVVVPSPTLMRMAGW